MLGDDYKRTFADSVLTCAMTVFVLAIIVVLFFAKWSAAIDEAIIRNAQPQRTTQIDESTVHVKINGEDLFIVIKVEKLESPKGTGP